MPQTTALANQNEGTLFNGDFARGYVCITWFRGHITYSQKRDNKKNYHLKCFLPAHCGACQPEQRCFALWQLCIVHTTMVFLANENHRRTSACQQEQRRFAQWRLCIALWQLCIVNRNEGALPNGDFVLSTGTKVLCPMATLHCQQEQRRFAQW